MTSAVHVNMSHGNNSTTDYPNTTIALLNTSMMTMTHDSALMMTSNPTDVTTMTWSTDCLVIPRRAASSGAPPSVDPVTVEAREDYTLFVNAGLLTVLFLIGSPANVVNMIIFFRQGLKERINLCLFSLSLADFLVITLHFAWSFDWAVKLITGDDSALLVMRPFINNNIIVLAGLIYVSSFLSAVIAMERCFCVVSPFRSQFILQTRTMAAIIAVTTVVIVGSHYIVSGQWRVICIFDPASGQERDVLSASEFYAQNKELVHFFDGVVYGLLIPGLCLTAVTVATVITVVRLRAMARWRGKATSANDSAALTPKDVALTRMLVGISVLYIVCTTPGFLFHTAVMFVPDLSLGGKYANTFILMIKVQQTFTFINSSVNFLVYYITGSKYRQTLQSLCCTFVRPKGQAGKVKERQVTSMTDQTSSPSV